MYKTKTFANEWGYAYLLDNVYKIDRNLNNSDILDHYLIDYSTSSQDKNALFLKKFGPLSVYQIVN